MGIELKATLKTRKLLILLNVKNAKNSEYAEVRYTAGTRTGKNRALDSPIRHQTPLTMPKHSLRSHRRLLFVHPTKVILRPVVAAYRIILHQNGVD